MLTKMTIKRLERKKIIVNIFYRKLRLKDTTVQSVKAFIDINISRLGEK